MSEQTPTSTTPNETPTGLEQIPTPDLLKLKEELEREWDTAYVNSLPDSAFAWIDPAYGKTSDNKNLRKLEHHDREGNLDRRHLTAAMAALLGARGGVDIPSSDRREAYNHLARHYRELQMEPPEFHEARVEKKKEVKSSMSKEEAGKGIVAGPVLQEAISPWQLQVANRLKEALTTTDAAKAIPIIWGPQVELGAQPKRVMRTLGIVDTTLRGSPGNKFYFPKVPTILEAIDATEATKPDDLAITVDRLEITVKEIIAPLSVTRQVIEQVTFNVIDVLTDLLSQAVANKEDKDILAALNAASGIAGTVCGGGKAAENEVAAGDVFDTDILADAITAMRNNNRDARFLVIHPAQENALLKSDRFVNAAQYGGREVIMNGEIGQYLGIRVLKTTQVPTGTGAGGITTYHAFLLGERAWVEEVKRDPDVESKYEAGERKTYMYGTMEYGLGVLNAKGIVKIITA